MPKTPEDVGQPGNELLEQTYGYHPRRGNNCSVPGTDGRLDSADSVECQCDHKRSRLHSTRHIAVDGDSRRWHKCGKGRGKCQQGAVIGCCQSSLLGQGTS